MAQGFPKYCFTDWDRRSFIQRLSDIFQVKNNYKSLSQIHNARVTFLRDGKISQHFQKKH